MSVSAMESIERFAEIIAILDDGVADRAAVLAAAGFDAPTWRQIEDHWMGRLEAGDDPALVERFATTYGLMRQSFSSTRTQETPARDDSLDQNAMPEPWRSDVSADGITGSHDTLRQDDIECTLVVPVAPHGPVLPFRSGPADPHWSHPFERRPGEPIGPPVDPADMMFDCPLEVVPKPVLPFVKAEEAPAGSAADTSADEQLDARRVLDLFQHVPRDGREVMLRVALGEELQAAADELGITPEAASARLRRGREAFSQIIARRQNHPLRRVLDEPADGDPLMTTMVGRPGRL